MQEDAQDLPIDESSIICTQCACTVGVECIAESVNSETICSELGSFAPLETLSLKTPKGSKLTPFLAKWTYGININVPLLNLTNQKGKSFVCYGAAHSGIMYDYKSGIMEHFQGHKNYVKCLSADRTGRWIAVADSGEESTCVVWDTAVELPIFYSSLCFENQSVGVVAISPNAKYLVSASNGETSIIGMNRWTYGVDELDDTCEVKGCGAVLKIDFKRDISEDILVAYEKKVVFIKWNDIKGKFEPPDVPVIRNRKQMGRITDCIFLNRSYEAVAVSTGGCLAVFGKTLYAQEENQDDVTSEIIFVKLIKVSTAAINCITSYDNLVVTGDEAGLIKFYDTQLKILYWYENSQLSAIRSVAFDFDAKQIEIRDPTDFEMDDFVSLSSGPIGDYEDRSEEFEIIYKNMVPSDCTLQRRPFAVGDFMILSSTGNIFRMKYTENELIPLFSNADDIVAGIETHSEKPLLCIAYENGRIVLFNYLTNEKFLEEMLPEATTADETGERATVTNIKYSLQSLFLACSRSNGEVWMLDQIVLSPKYKTPFRFSKHKIEKLLFSFDCKFLAYYDSQRTVCLCKHDANADTWDFLGKVKGHYKPINDIVFSPFIPLRLFTIGEDGLLVEYTVDCAPGDFTAISNVRIEQTAIPVSFMYEPIIYPSGEHYLLITDTQFKYKRLNDRTLAYHSVILGPCFKCYKGSPVNQLAMLPQSECNYLIFATDRHLGIQMYPPDGNPFKYISLIAHPEKIKEFCISRDGKYVFTAGEYDRSVFMWSVNVGAVDVLEKLGGTEIEPFYTFIDGGRSGWLFSEMQDLFYYMQILHQGEDNPLPRVVSDFICISELPDLMKACGFYLTEKEAEHLMMDIKYREYDETLTIREKASFFEFVQLYVNHKPAHGVCLSELKQAFKTLTDISGDYEEATVPYEEFLEQICTRGEVFNRISADTCLSVLMRVESNYDKDYEEPNFEYLPEELTFDIFVDEILGLDVENLNPEGINIGITKEE